LNSEADRQREIREEAERLKLLPRDQQRRIVELIALPAKDSHVAVTYRKEALRRARALSKLLKLTPKKRRRKP